MVITIAGHMFVIGRHHKVKINITITSYPTVFLNDCPVQFPTKKSEGIFYYLILNKKCTKETLETMFWPEYDQASANKNLRNSIYYIQKLFGKEFFKKEKGILGVSPSVTIMIDSDPIRGDVLQGFFIQDCPDFELFLDDYKRSHNLIIYDKLKEDLRRSLEKSDADEAIKYFLVLKQMNPYDEDIVHQITTFYQQRNMLEKCIQFYKDLEKTLNDDLSIEPNLELKNLYRTILSQKKLPSKKNTKYFYGRKQEFEKIYNSHLRFANALHHANYIIVSSIGGGKTALLNHYLSTIADPVSVTIQLRCYEVEKSTQLRVLEIIVYKFLNATGINPGNLPESCRYLLAHIFPKTIKNFVYDFQFSEDNSPLFLSQYKIEESLSEIFSYLLDKYKLILVIDDLQYCDLSSLSFITRILCPLFKKQIFYLFSSRKENYNFVIPYFKDLILETDLEIMHLSNFSREDIAHIIRDLLHKNEKSLVDALYDSTNGNPLFLMEIVRNIKSNSSTKDYTFLSLLEEKMERMAPEEKTILYISSFFFDFINYEIISGITNMDVIKTLEIFESLANQGFIKEEASINKIKIRFSHEKFREYIYHKQPLIKRMTLHGKIADYIASQILNENIDSYLMDSIMFHYKQAGQIVKYIEYKLKMSSRIIDINYDFPELLTPITQSYIEDLEQEINANSVPPPLKFDFYLLKGCFFIRSSRYQEGLQSLNYVIDSDYDNRRLFIAYRYLILYSVAILDRKLMKKYSLKALRLLKKYPDELKKGEILKFYALSEIYYHNFKNAQEKLNLCLTIFNREEPNAFVLNNIACIYNYMGYEARYNGDYAKTIPYYKKAIRICESANFLNGLALYYMNIGQSLYKLGDIDNAYKYFYRSNELHYKIDLHISKSLTNAYLSLICFQKEDYLRAKEHMKHALELQQLLNNQYENAYIYTRSYV